MSSRTAAGQGSVRVESEVAKATKEDLELVRTVSQIVVRQFYQDQHAILIDVLTKHLVMPAEILAKALGVPIREMLQIANALVRDRLISVFRRSESKESGPSNYVRPILKNYFYFDRKMFLDVVKWRIMRMRSQIDSVLRNELDNKGYMCPRCAKSYSTLDVANLLDPVEMKAFICDVPGCGSELVDNEVAEDVMRSRDRLRRFNEQCGPILDRLRRIDNFALPHFDLMAEIARNGDSDAWIRRALQRRDPNTALPDVGFATGGARVGPSIEIDMVSSNPEAEAQRRLEREAEAARRREENALPIWLQQTQDPNARSEGAQVVQGNADLDEAGLPGDVDAAEREDYYARYASMAQEEEAEDDMGDFELEEVVGNGTASQSNTPQTSGKRSREESEAGETNNKRAREDDDDEDDDEENIEFEEVA